MSFLLYCWLPSYCYLFWDGSWGRCRVEQSFW